MKHLVAIVFICGIYIPYAYGETINYDTGDKYVGDVSNGVSHGQGTYTWANGSKYVGEWKDGLKHGQGTFFYVGGAKYIGEYKDNLRHGQGIYTHADGSKYVGEVKDDGPWNGIEYNADGTVAGTFSNGEWISK